MLFGTQFSVEKNPYGFGELISSDLTPLQMLEKAKLDWTVRTEPLFCEIGGVKTPVNRTALIRDSDNEILDLISPDWNPLQNQEAFEWFNDFVAAGELEMHSAGEFKNGRHVWVLAKAKEAFELFGGKDRVESYILFSNPHVYGRSIDVKTTMIRPVCWNSFAAAISGESKSAVKVNHRATFDGDYVKECLGVAKERLEKYKEAAEFLSKKRFKEEDVVTYFKRIFPAMTTKRDSKEFSRNAKLCIEQMDTQPGAEIGEGTYWSMFNSLTYATNHLLGRTDDNRRMSVWHGDGAKINERGLKLALEMAS